MIREVIERRWNEKGNGEGERRRRKEHLIRIMKSNDRKKGS